MQRREKAWIEAFALKGRPLGQKADRIMAVQAFLMAGHDAEIADLVMRLQLGAEEPHRILDKDRIGGVQFGEGLFVLALDHHLGFRGDGGAAEVVRHMVVAARLGHLVGARAGP